MPLPTPNKGEKEKDFISRCMGNNTMKKEYPDTKQRTAVCYSQWRRSKKQKQSQEARNVTRELYQFDIATDNALEWIKDKQGQYEFTDSDGNKHTAVAVIGDRFYHGKFLPGKELEKGYRTMDGAYHDINHMGTSYSGGLFSPERSNIEYIIGYQKGTTYNPTTKQMKTNIFIKKDAPKYNAWKNYVDISRDIGRQPNVSVSFWASRKDMLAKDLGEDIDYKTQGFKEDDIVPYLYDIEFRALSTVLQGACNDKAGCGIGIGMNQTPTDTPTYVYTDMNGNPVDIIFTNNDNGDEPPVDPNIKKPEDEDLEEKINYYENLKKQLE